MNLTQKFELVWPKLKSLSGNAGNDGNGELEKLLAMAVLGLGSLIAGLLPAYISEHNRRRFPLTTSLMLCFGAGILLATAIIHILPEVLFLLGAVACHKFVMGFCLGLKFRSNPQTPLKSHIIGVSVFALGAICGIGLGMIIVDVPSLWSTTALPVIQGLAGGTLLYVTVCEVIPHEKARWHSNSGKRLAGLAQFIMVVIGFTVMCLLNFYFDDDI